MSPHTPHACPHCRCLWDTTDDAGRVDKDAPFYPLVALIASLEDVNPRRHQDGHYRARAAWRGRAVAG